MKKVIVLAMALMLAATSAYALTNGRDGSGGEFFKVRSKK